MPDVTNATEEVMRAFEEFKATNEANLKQRDAVLEEKLAKINAALDRFEPLNKQVTLAAQQQAAMQEQLDRVEALLNRPKGGSFGALDKEAAEYKAAFYRCMRRAPADWDPADAAVMSKRKAALVRSDDAGAGYLLAPPDVNAEIIKDVVELSPMRSLATVRTIGGPSLKQPKRIGTAGATRVGETTSRTNTGDPSYGMVEITAPEMFARAEISQQMLEDSDYDLEAELRSEFAEQFAWKEGWEFINGSGTGNQAEGILTNPDIGKVKSGAAAALTADGMIDLFYGLKTAYTRNAVWIMNRSTIGAVRKLKDNNGQYLWTPGIAGTVPNTILGAIYVEMPDMPDVGAGAFPVAFGDFRRGYVIVDRVTISFQADFTTGADNGVVVYRARKRVGGGVRQPETIKKLEISA